MTTTATPSLEVRSPFDDRSLARLPMQDEAELETMLVRARALHDDRDAWLSPSVRKGILLRAATAVEAGLEDLAQLAASEGGKPITDSRAELLRAVDGIRWAAEEIARLTGEPVPMGLNAASEGHLAYTFREPVGVVAAVSAFNHPFNLIVHQVVTAVAAGCPVIVKPASTTPLSALALVDILAEAGLPAGWAQTLISDNAVAEKLVTDPRIAFFSFIGSGRVGWYLRSKLAPGVGCALEHGGAAPVLVEPDADIEDALPLIVKGGFYHAGQVCVSVQRLFVHQDVLQPVLDGLVSAARQLRVGDPLDPTTDVGPLILDREVVRVDSWVQRAAAAGGQILCGGERVGQHGYAPTVVLDPPDEVELSRLEVFGPVVVVYPYTDRDVAIRRANQLDFCFQAAVFTGSLDTALECARRLNANAVMVNQHSAFRVDWMPFGGRSSSGMRLGGIGHTMRDLSAERMVVIRSKAVWP